MKIQKVLFPIFVSFGVLFSGCGATPKDESKPLNVDKRLISEELNSTEFTVDPDVPDGSIHLCKLNKRGATIVCAFPNRFSSEERCREIFKKMFYKRFVNSNDDRRPREMIGNMGDMICEDKEIDEEVLFCSQFDKRYLRKNGYVKRKEDFGCFYMDKSDITP